MKGCRNPDQLDEIQWIARNSRVEFRIRTRRKKVTMCDTATELIRTAANDGQHDKWPSARKSVHGERRRIVADGQGVDDSYFVISRSPVQVGSPAPFFLSNNPISPKHLLCMANYEIRSVS